MHLTIAMLQASVRNVHLISACLATPASSSDQNGTFIFTINDNNNLVVVVNVFLKLELVVRWGDTTSRCRSVCLQLNLNHFVQVRLPWEPGLGRSHNKNQRLSQTRTETKANPNISLLSALWSIWSSNRLRRSGGISQEYKALLWPGPLSHGTVKSCSDH